MTPSISLSFPATADCTLEIFHLIFSLEPTSAGSAGAPWTMRKWRHTMPILPESTVVFWPADTKIAICLILDLEHIYQSIDESLWTEPFLLTDTPHSKRVPGYPLDRLSLDIATRKYYYDLPDRVVDSSAVHTGYYQIFPGSLPSRTQIAWAYNLQ